MKKIISLLLIVAAMSGMTSFAAKDPNPPADIDESVSFADSSFDVVTSYGKITELGDEYVVVSTNDGTSVQFNYDESTYVIDSEALTPLSLTDRTSDDVIVYHSSIMTRSIPAQSYAYSIIGNVKSDMGNPIFTIVESVEKTDDGLSITTNNGSLIVTLPNTAKVTPYLTKNIVTLDDITVNSKILLWYDTVTMSLPAYASSEKAVILESGIEDDNESGLVINGITVELKEDEAAYIENDVRMLPLRTVAEALGCTVTWNEADASIAVEKGDFSTVVYIAEFNDINFKAVSRSLNNGHRAVLNGSKTYVEESFFNQL